MKKIILLIVLLLGVKSFAQTNGITYQAVILNPSGEQLPGVNNSNSPMVAKNICLQFQFIDEFSKLEYQETIQTKTDSYGMVNLIIGSGSQTAGYANSFVAIDWSSLKKSLVVSLSLSGSCNSFLEISNQPFTTIPFAFSAINAGNVTGVVAIENGGTNAITVLGAKTNLGLANVDNTSDLNKPISNASKLALDLKEASANKSTDGTLASNSDVKFPTEKAIKTYVDAKIATSNSATQTVLDTKAPLESPAFTGTVSGINKTMVGLANVDNTSDVNKPVSTAGQGALDLKVDKAAGERLINASEITKLSNQSGTNTGDQDLSKLATTAATTTALDLKVDKVIGERLINAPEITKLSNQSGANTGDQDLSALATTAATTTALDLKANLASPTFTGTVSGINKTMVGLANVDNTSDVNKPVSTAGQGALDLKVDKAAGERLINASEITKLSNQSGVNTGDQDLSALATTAATTTALDLKANLASPTFTGTVSGINKTMVGLANVDNTSDVNKPVSTAGQGALDLKVDKAAGERLINASEITKLSNQSGTNTGDQDLSALATTAATTTALDLKANLASPAFTGTVSGIDKTTVGLGNVDNTSDADKPLSIATDTALDSKVDKVSGKELSANDYTDIEKAKLTAIIGTNTGDQDLSTYAPVASPNLTGVPLAPTPINTTNSTQIATTAFVQDLLLNSSSTTSTQLNGAIWTNSTSGTLNGVPFTLTNIRAQNQTSWDLSAPDFMAAPLSETQMLVGYSVSDDWTLTFASPVSDLKLYCRYWRAADYVFDQPFSILSGSGLVANNNTLTVNGWGNGVLEFAGPITTLNVNSNQVIGQNDSSQIMTFGANAVSQPLSGSGEVVRSNSPTFTGTPLATTADSGTSTSQIATTEFVSTAIADKFVDLTTDQTIKGVKTFIDGIKTIRIDTSAALDQENTSSTGSAGGTSQWQSFTANKTGILSAVEWQMSNPTDPYGTAANVTVKIYEGEGVSGALLGTAASVTPIDGTASFINFNLETQNINALSGLVYTIELTTPSVQIGWLSLSTSNSYTLGRGSNDTNWDYIFKTYVKEINEDSYAISSLSVPYTGATGPVNLGAYDLKINGANFGTNGQLGNIGIGIDAGSFTPGQNTVAIGNETGLSNQGSNAVAIGAYTAGVRQGSNAVAVGYQAAYTNQGASAIAIGNEAALTYQGANAIAIGNSTGSNNQGIYALAIGGSAGSTDQGSRAIAMGTNSGNANQGSNAIAVGDETGYENQGSNAVAIGTMAGKRNQGSNAIAIGSNAGKTNQNSNSIILNATGDDLDSTTSGFFVDPVRNVSSATALFYDANTKEITYGSSPSVSLASGVTGILPVSKGGSGVNTSTGTGSLVLSASPTFTGTVNGITATMVGLPNVNNTSDANKPVSTATQTALDAKANTSTMGNLPSLTTTANSNLVAAINEINYTAAGKANIASPTFTGTVSGIDKTMVGLPNVDNISDADKPVSTATQTALDAKANTSSMGNLTSLTTTAKSNLVAAINEIEAGKSNFVDLTTDQTIAGAKTFGSDAIVNTITVGRGAGDQSDNTTLGAGALVNNLVSNTNPDSFGQDRNSRSNTAIGYYTLNRNTLGGNNTAIGATAMSSNTTGNDNTAIGSRTFNTNTTGSGNTAVGVETLFNNNTGSDNTVVGYQALQQNNGNDNTAIGRLALYGNRTGVRNTAIGKNALYDINREATGTSDNTALGYNAGSINKGASNTFLGSGADQNSGNVSITNSTAIGYQAKVNAANTIQLGNDQITAVNTNGSINSSGTITSVNLNTKSANIGSSEAEPSAVLSLSSSSKGFLPPRMTSDQRIAISNPALGLVVYQVNNKDGLYFYNGTTWVYIIKQNGSSSEYLMADGSVSSKFKPTAAIADLHGITADLSGTVIYIPSADFNVVIEPELPVGFNCVIINASESAYTISMSEHPMFYSTQFKGVNNLKIAAGSTVHINVITVDNQKRYYISGDISSPSIDVADELTVNDDLTLFTLSQIPSVNSKVRMYINGIRISNTAYSIVDRFVTYIPGSNGDKILNSEDRIQFDYYTESLMIHNN